MLRAFPPKAAAAAPTGATAVVDDFTLEGQLDGSVIFEWTYRNPGDYDQNSQVNISDLTPVGISFGSKQSDEDWLKHEPVDGDANGQITIADVTPIGQNFNVSVEGYELQFTLTPESEASWQSGQIAAFDTSSIPAGGGRRRFSLQLPATDNSLAEGMNFRVRPFTGSGASREYGSPSVSVQLGTGVGPNNLPIAVLEITPPNGLAPLTVELSGQNSGDIDGTLESYEVDFDGPIGGEAWVEMGPGALLAHTYGAGDYLCALRVTDDRGGTDTDVALVKARTETPPVAALTGDSLSGPTPLHVVWDASASLDTDGLVVKYEWDFDDDGEYEFDSGADPTTDFYYYDMGYYPVALRITDNDGLTATASNTASASLGASWHLQENLPTIEGFEQQAGSDACLAVIDDKPAASYSVVESNDIVGAPREALLTRATDAEGSGWDEPTVLPHIQPGDYAPTGGALKIVNGKPGLFISDMFLRAQDEQGLSWDAPITLYGPNSAMGNWPSIIFMTSTPVYCSSGKVMRAGDFFGTSWLEPTLIMNNVASSTAVTIDSLGFLAMENASDTHALFLSRALSPDGSKWSAPIVVNDSGNTGGRPLIVDSAGSPGILFVDYTLNALKFVRALEPDGRHWGEPVYVQAIGGQDFDGGLWQGRPIALYRDAVTGSTCAIMANTASGESWSLPSLVDDAPIQGIQSYGSHNCYQEIIARPSLLYGGTYTYLGNFIIQRKQKFAQYF